MSACGRTDPDEKRQTPVELRFDLGIPERDICQLSPSPINGSLGSFSFRSSARLTTSDGQIDTPLELGSATPTTLFLEGNSSPEQIPVEEFASRTGIRGVDARNQTSLGSSLVAHFYRRDGNIEQDGRLWVQGDDCISADDCSLQTPMDVRWPLDDANSSFCH